MHLSLVAKHLEGAPANEQSLTVMVEIEWRAGRRTTTVLLLPESVEPPRITTALSGRSPGWNRTLC
eukprot:53615-Prymnesium_polylepis.1